MGSLTLPASGLVYADAQITLYSADGHPVYAPICRPLWQPGRHHVVTSYLALAEILVGPLRAGNILHAAQRENLWLQPNTRMLPVSETVLREVANLRATVPGLNTPDAIHAANALLHGCALFVTNDIGFRRLPQLPLVLLDDLISPT